MTAEALISQGAAALGGSFAGLAGIATAWASLALVILLILQYVLLPLLTERQRRSFDVVFVPLLAMFVLFILADFLEAAP